ncbi:cyclic pyranopterin monophosphate synthase MoaC [Halofilum ochraceum]|uniref:cyclic pyranopterin monophosphate synthase MoaC n=1 Tax=Halofilum ochraceum TaxID=1611323 RepID=UPI0008DA6383|nr:cyclic pyranopterin monophosphate synthase MoaC [Halofilum ochraceum]
MSEFTHFNRRGEAHVVDVGGKDATRRVAVAAGRIHMEAATLERIESGEQAKGDVLGVARIAGIMGAKRTSELIPLCHPIALTSVEVEFELESEDSAITCRATAQTTDRTGVEMEAMTAVQIALLTIYDMCKSADRGMMIDAIRLLEKSGGKSGDWRREDPA